MAKWFRKTFFIGGKAVEAEVRAGDITMYDRAGNIVQKFYPYHEEEWAKFIADEFGEFLKEKDGA